MGYVHDILQRLGPCHPNFSPDVILQTQCRPKNKKNVSMWFSQNINDKFLIKNCWKQSTMKQVLITWNNFVSFGNRNILKKWNDTSQQIILKTYTSQLWVRHGFKCSWLCILWRKTKCQKDKKDNMKINRDKIELYLFIEEEKKYTIQ